MADFRIGDLVRYEVRYAGDSVEWEGTVVKLLPGQAGVDFGVNGYWRVSQSSLVFASAVDVLAKIGRDD